VDRKYAESKMDKTSAIKFKNAGWGLSGELRVVSSEWWVGSW
jgi:hypothetical protein